MIVLYWNVCGFSNSDTEIALKKFICLISLY